MGQQDFVDSQLARRSISGRAGDLAQQRVTNCAVPRFRGHPSTDLCPENRNMRSAIRVHFLILLSQSILRLT